MKILRRVGLWFLNKKIDQIIQKEARLMIATHAVKREFDKALDARDAYAAKHGLRPHPRTLDSDWDRLKREYGQT